jgi:hypothetical protein
MALLTLPNGCIRGLVVSFVVRCEYACCFAGGRFLFIFLDPVACNRVSSK